jgi:LacI family transcriptional regulator
MINGSVNTFSGSERYKAYESVLQSHGLPIEPHYILNGEFLKQNAYHEVKGLLASGQELPTAFFTANDDMAAAAYEAFKEFGFSIPNDISIVGFDDGPIATQLAPKLTTVQVPIYDMSKEAVHKVVALCEQTVTAFSTVSFPAPLIVRDSCRQL